MGSILIVDDDDSFAAALQRITEKLGHTCVRAVDGQDGLTKFYDGSFDLVIVDLKMPRMNGVEFIREAKRIDRDVVAMVITGYSDLQTAVETLTLGAYDYIEKPVEIEKFKAALDRGLEKRRLLSQTHFSKGIVWMAVISIPLWMVLGIILSLLWKK